MESNNLEEGELVLCTVDKIIGTTVFVKIDSYGIEGTITTSEIAPGRIRNLRDYVVPGKKIVCKALSLRENSVHLSLRRVKPNEKKELLERIEKENSYKAIFKTVLGKEKADEIVKKILGEKSLFEFFEEIKENQKILEKYVTKEDADKIIKIIESKKEKPKEIKEVFRLSSKSSNGILLIKKIVKDSCEGSSCKVSYLAAGKYSISIIGEDLKKVGTELNKVLEKIENYAKKEHLEFSLEKSK